MVTDRVTDIGECRVAFATEKLDFTGFQLIPGNITQFANSSYEVLDLRDVGSDAILHF